MKNNQSNIAAILNASTVSYTPVSATETGCRAVFRAAAHHRFQKETSPEERNSMGYKSNDWDVFFDPTAYPTREAAREAGNKIASVMLG